MNVEDLPEEMLVQVLLGLGHPSHLPLVALVCQRWHRVSNDPRVQRLWWGNHPFRLHRPLRHRCRTALSCGLSPDLDSLFGDHVITVQVHPEWYHFMERASDEPRGEPVVLLAFSSLTGVYR